MDDSVQPVRYRADLTLRPGAATFPGSIDIDINLRRPASLIWLNATGITIRQAALTIGGASRTAAVEPGDTDFVGLRFPAAVPAGPAQLRIQYEGKINAGSSSGIFPGRDGGETYLFTQFESTDARRAFPCFDQPNFKTPWQVTLHVPQGDKAISNTMPVSETSEPDGLKRVAFAPTKPLPSYLVAFAVGPFDIVDAGAAGRNHVPVRIITPKGKAYQAKYAAEVTAPIIQRLEDYFGVPFPYDKADQVAIPQIFGFGAMENAGMVTYAQTILLSDPAIDTARRQRQYASDAAHELAHQWFGDLVTLAWRDDAWLNEAFATWASSKILAEWQPQWNTRLDDLGSKFGAMRQDSLVSARRIRQPIESRNDIANAFDGITYDKGAAVIRMFESWVGEKRFRQGVNAYLRRHAYQNATAGDFLDAIAASGQPRLTQAFSTFLEQPGFPEISAELRCDGSPRVALSQKRYLPIGSSGAANQLWQVPVCMRYQTPAGPQQECFLLDRAQAEFRLTKTNACPAELWANDNAAGYYQVRYQGDLLPALLKTSGPFLNAAERRTLLHDLGSLAGAGEATPGQALDAALLFANAPERQLVTEAEGVVGTFRRLVPASLRPNYQRFIRKAFGARAAALGWTAKPTDTEDTRLLRARLVPYVAIEGDDPALQAEARRLADSWLRDHKGVDPEMLSAVLTTAAYSGNRALFDRFRAELNKTTDRQLRRYLLAALGRFRDPDLAQSAMQLTLDPTLDAREALFPLLFGPMDTPGNEKLPLEFLEKHYAQLAPRLPSGAGFDAGAQLTAVGSEFCTEDARQEFVRFFQDRVKSFLGGPRNYQQTLERIRLCEARNSAQGAALDSFLSRQ
ncbi:MAG TPA: M1 family metallopeptidase [Bryobacteraceae bacterium]|nr:M1 family metallopeptidase [Bryobacteraceae bacterium]